MKKLIALIVIIVLIIIGFFLYKKSVSDNQNSNPNPTQNQPVEPTPPPVEPMNQPEETIGTSVDGNPITAYHFGTGDKEVVFVSAIHGGYAWNTAQVGYDLVDRLKANPTDVPEGVKVTVIPVLNPDGLKETVGSTGRFELSAVPSTEAGLVPGRFNSHDVDLNRNFDCDWKSTGVWQSKPVSGGTAAFSEPETQALRDYVMAHKPAAVVAYYAAVGGVFASSCHNGVSSETLALTKAYSTASGYKAYEDFDFYEINGDMVNWLAKENIPAISVLLTNHKDVEWDRNWKGIQAVISRYASTQPVQQAQ